MQSVGIDVGQHSIKVIELNVTKKGFSVHNYFEHILGSNPSLDYELEVIDFLQQLITRYDLENTKFNVALRQDQVSVINKTFPFNEKLKINKSLSYEIEEDLPFAIDDCVIDAKILKTMGPQTEVLAVATPHESIEKFLKVFMDVGIHPTVLSTEGFALFNLFENWQEPPPVLQGHANIESTLPPRFLNIHLHIGHTHTVINFLDGLTPLCTRSILWGGKNLAEAIARKYEIPYVEALKELQNKAFILTQKKGASWDQINFSDVISQSTQLMVKDLRLILFEVRTQFNATFEKAFMTGGTSQILNLGPYLTQQLEVPVNKFNVFEHFGPVAFEKTTRIEAVTPLALGLAIEALKKPKNPAINLLKGPFVKESNLLKHFWQKWGLTAQATTLAFILFFVFASMKDTAALSLNDRTQDALKNIARKVAGLKGAKSTPTNIKKYIQEQQKKAQELKNISMVAKMNSALDIVKKLNDAFPGRSEVGLEIKKLDIKDNVVSIEGYTSNAEQINKIKNNLLRTSVDGKVSPLTSTLPALGGRSPFALSVRVDRNVQKVTK